MSTPMGPRFGRQYGPRDKGRGALPFIGDNGIIDWLEIPSDWATVSYVLGISDGIPAWLPAGTDTVLDGFGNSFGNNFGGIP